MSLRVAFRVAASPIIGGGHVVRSVSIANALAASGATCIFFIHYEAVASAPILARSGHALVRTPGDAATAIQLAREKGPFNWLVVDDYALAAADEITWREIASKTLVVDDLADRAHDCDLLMDSTPSRRAQDYVGLVPEATRLLLGPAYAPLRAEFAHARSAALARREDTEHPARLLISFGLVDPGGIAGQAVEAIAGALPDLAIDVVLGPLSLSRAKIEKLAPPNVTLHIDPPSMTALMLAADVALGAGGSTAWERACLGLPAVALILAENQRPLARALEARGALQVLENRPGVWEEVVAALRDIIRPCGNWRAMSKKAALACDGLGANRVALALDPAQAAGGAPIRLRPVCWDDTDQIFEWQTAPGARDFSSNPEPPSIEGHKNWMARKLEEPGCIFNVIELEDRSAGVLRLNQRQDGSFLVSILVADVARGRGVGLAALQAGARLMGGARLWAKIDSRNAASLRIFAKAGFIHKDGDLYFREGKP